MVRTRSRRERERGTVIVEAAMVLPIFMLIVFGIIEWGLAFKNVLTISSSVRSGVRTGSAQPRKNGYQDAIRLAVEAALDNGTNLLPQELWIYKAGTNGFPVGRSNFDSGCNSTQCWRYTWNGTAFTETSGYSWPAINQNACGGTADELGVYLKAQHSFITKFFGDTKTLGEKTIMRLEPIPVSEVCQP